MARKKKTVAKKTTAKRGPGRPRKLSADDFNFPKPAEAMAAKRRPGRPAKTKMPDAGFGLLRGAVTVHSKVIEDLRIRINDTLYRLGQLEDRIKAGPGLLPVLVTQGSDVNKLSARTLAQVLLSRLVENEDPEPAS